MNVDELELADAILYKTEGTRLRRNKRYPLGNTFYYTIEFTNPDPVLIKIFLDFLRTRIKVSETNIKCELFIYSDHNKDTLETFWAKTTKLPLNQFHKTIILQAKNSKYKPNPLGTCKIDITVKKIFLN